MSSKHSDSCSERTRKSKHNSSNRVLRTITFVLTPFLMLAIVFCVCSLALSKPYSEAKPYLNIVFDIDKKQAQNIRTLNKYRDDNAPVNIKSVEDDITGETHTIIYPYYGDMYATLNCESAGLNDIPVYSGTTNDVLENGAGWFNGSVYIGNVGNVVIAAHNHTFFYYLPNCKEGDIVTLETEYCKLTYVVTEKVIFHDTDLTYVRPTEDDRLTMYTCWNNGRLGMSEYRLGIICELTEREWKEVEVEE